MTMSTIYHSQMDPQKPNLDRRLFCIEYPGRVNNVNKALLTLGGTDMIGVTYGQKNRRVELRFRPDDVYCKPACGDRHATIGLLIKVKIKRKIRDVNMPCSSKDSEKLHSMTFVTSLVGIVDTIYKFDNICDFQYLPIDFSKNTLEIVQNKTKNVSEESSDCDNNTNDNVLVNIHDRILPSYLPTRKWLETDDTPYFLTPPVFSRFDTVHYYNSKAISNDKGKTVVEKKDKEKKKKEDVPNTIGRTRRRRQGYTIFVNYTDENIPMEPNPEAMNFLKMKMISDKKYEILKKLFDERPIWSKNGILYNTNLTKDQLKFLLPTIAFYFVTGPWRVMWCRYGYDPRQMAESKKYQTFDYRVRTVGGFKNKVKAKRSYSNYLLPYKSSPSSRPKVVIINRHSIARAYQEAKKEAALGNVNDRPEENTCIFRPGYIPPTRQMFYQFCDVLIPEIQTMLRELETSPSVPTKCHPAFGFLPAGFDRKCRDIVNSLVATELKKQIQVEAGTSSQEQSGLKRKHGDLEDDVAFVDEENDVVGECLEEEEDGEDGEEEIIDSDMEESLMVDSEDDKE